MSFFGDAQEFPALIFSELHVEMLAFYLQFSRLDDVIHFPLKPPTLTHPFWVMEEKSAEFVQILSPFARATREGFQKGINEMKKLIFTRKWRDKRRITQAISNTIWRLPN